MLKRLLPKKYQELWPTIADIYNTVTGQRESDERFIFSDKQKKWAEDMAFKYPEEIGRARTSLTSTSQIDESTLVTYKKVPGLFGIGTRTIGPFIEPLPSKQETLGLPEGHRDKHITAFVARKYGWDMIPDYGGKQRKAVYAFDFDGVLIDSVTESSEVAWRAASKLWPEIFDSPSPVTMRKEELLKSMREARPVVETGYENIVLLRCLLEDISTEEILSSWETILPEAMEEWQLTREDLIIRFGNVRDEWIKDDAYDWALKNGVYNLVRYSLQKCVDRHDVYIVTTKQKRFVDELVRERLRIHLPAARIFDTSRGRSKADFLKELQAKHPDASRYVFVEDKLSTLKKVKAEPELESWKLWLADWGYNQKHERDWAKNDDRIDLLQQGLTPYHFFELYEDGKKYEPKYERKLKAHELDLDDYQRLARFQEACERVQMGIETDDDMDLIYTTPEKYYRDNRWDLEERRPQISIPALLGKRSG